MEQKSQRKIRKIKQLNLEKNKIKNVVAYARVSGDKDMAIHSLDAQIAYFEEYIKNHQGWEFAKMYIDESISGTKADRPGFMQMMEDARAGKIDIILTKSISRFARNTIVLLDAIRELNKLGVDVYFEKENVHTASTTGELMLTVLATFAEEEARSASLNQLWRIRRMFEAGRPTYTRMLGYYMENEQLKIIPEEAEIIRRIYKYYLSGMGRDAIVRRLAKENIKTIHGTRFGTSHILVILTNEKYTGNTILQKTYRENFRTKKKMKNKGEKPQYFVENSHDAIIDRETWEAVQAEIKRRKDMAHENSINSHKLRPYPFTGIIICGNCKKHFRRMHHRDKKYRWACSAYLLYGKDVCPVSGIPEQILINKTKEAIKAILPNADCEHITSELTQKYLTNIIVPEHKKLIFNFKNGASYSTEWDYKSRRESWTPEMKEKARRKALEVHERRKAEKEATHIMLTRECYLTTSNRKEAK